MKFAATIMLIFIFTLFGLLAVSAFAAEAVLSDDEKLQCRLGGGCLFITEDALLKQLRQAYEAGKREGSECKRPMT